MGLDTKQLMEMNKKQLDKLKKRLRNPKASDLLQFEEEPVKTAIINKRGRKLIPV